MKRAVAMALACAVLAPFHSALADEDPVNDPLVAQRMHVYYEGLLGRKLTPKEAHGVTQEFLQGHGRGGKSSQNIRDLAFELGLNGILLREEKNSPAALSLRHALLEANYFRPSMQNTLELKLLTEPDPVRVADAQSQRLMTEQDVLALANIYHFTKSKDAPLHRPLSSQQLDELTTLLNRSFKKRPGTLPRFFADASAFWAGVRQQWPYFNTQQRNWTRAYAASSWRTQMPVEMYMRLLGVDRQIASNRWSADVASRIRGRPDNIEGLDDLHAALDSMFAR